MTAGALPGLDLPTAPRRDSPRVAAGRFLCHTVLMNNNDLPFALRGLNTAAFLELVLAERGWERTEEGTYTDGDRVVTFGRGGDVTLNDHRWSVCDSRTADELLREL